MTTTRRALALSLYTLIAVFAFVPVLPHVAGAAGLATNDETTTATATPPKADYRFDNARTTSVGTAPAVKDVTNFSNNTFFINDTVENHQQSVLGFPGGTGIELHPTTGVVSANAYTIAMLVRMESVSGKQRLVDFSRGASGAGWFINNGRLVFVQSSFGGSGDPAGANFNSNSYVQFVFTRTAAGAIKSYINGNLAHTINDNSGVAVISSANALRFFIGDTTGSTDDTAGGRIARLRIYDTPLTEEEIAELDRVYDPPTGDLSVQISPPQSDFFVGNEFTYDVTTALSNANVPATGVRLTHSVPAGFEVLEVQNAKGTCANGSGSYTCELGTLVNNASAHVSFRVRAIAQGDYTMTASVTSDSTDTNTSNNSDNFSVRVRSRADLRLTQTASAPTAARNQEVAFNITVHNAGPNAATNVRVSHVPPALLTNVSCQTTAGTCAGTNSHTATIPELASGASATVTLTGRVHGSALNFAIVSNFAQLQADTPDPDAANNLAYASLVVRAPVANGKITFVADTSTSGDSIHTINPDGTALVDLSNITFTKTFGSDFAPAWSPDGTRYAFIGFAPHRGGSESTGRDIFIAEAGGTSTGGGLPTRIATPGRHNEGSMSWSPDGSRLVFDRALILDNGTCVGHCHNHIYTMNTDGTGEQKLTTSTKDYDPAWSPDGSRIAFMSERDGNAEIYVMNADGTNQTRLTNDPHADGAPAWSPDGSRIVFGRTTHTPSYSSDIYAMNPDGSNVVNLTNTAPDGQNTRAEQSPVWSPDGAKILYTVARYVGRDSNDNYDYDLYLMNPDGSSKTLIHTHPRAMYSTAWQPVPQNFVVTNTNDSGAGSLRQAMIDADAFNQAARITFQIPGTGVQTLRPASGYAHIETPVFLDATTQPGYAGAPLIEISGNLAANFVHGFVVRQGSLIKGFVINRFKGVGIFLLHNGNAVQGCYIGTNSDGTGAAPNSQAGILADNLANLIGGTSAATRNVISGNSGVGIATGVGGVAINSWSSRMTISGNYIGTDRTGTQPIPNGSNGIALSLQPAVIGGTEAGAGNLIANNGSHGIVVAAGRYKTIVGNSIRANGGLGISLNGNSFTPVPNDDGDPDTGANNLQNSPVIASAQTSNGVTVISGTINTRIAEDPNFFSDRNKITLHFYSSPACDSSGSGEGQTYIGSTVLYLSANVSTENFRFVPAAQIPTNHVITATATNGLGETSEFSACRPLTAGTLTAKIIGYARSRRNFQPIGDVEMRLTGAQTAIAHTNAQGIFEFANLPVGGTYTVTPSRAGFSFAPIALTIERLTGDAGADFEGEITGEAQTTPLGASGDAWVQGAAEFRDTNYGTSPELQVKRTLNPGAGRGRRAFLKFDTTYNVTGEVRSAKLRIFARLTTNNLAPTQMIAQKVTDAAWSETEMTWNNQPGVAAPTALASITVAGTTGAWYEFDLTQFVKAERAAGRPVIAVRLINMQATGTSGASYTAINSSDAEQNRPELVIEHR